MQNTEQMSQKHINLLDYIRTNISGGLVVNKTTNKLKKECSFVSALKSWIIFHIFILEFFSLKEINIVWTWTRSPKRIHSTTQQHIDSFMCLEWNLKQWTMNLWKKFRNTIIFRGALFRKVQSKNEFFCSLSLSLTI